MRDHGLQMSCRLRREYFEQDEAGIDPGFILPEILTVETAHDGRVSEGERHV